MFCLKGVQKETNKSFKVHPAQVHSLYISLQVNKGMDIQKPGKKSLESWTNKSFKAQLTQQIFMIYLIDYQPTTNETIKHCW